MRPKTIPLKEEKPLFSYDTGADKPIVAQENAMVISGNSFRGTKFKNAVTSVVNCELAREGFGCLTAFLDAVAAAVVLSSYSAGTGLQLVGTVFSISDVELLAIAGLTSAADRLPYFTGLGTASLATFTAFGRSLIDDADATAAKVTLGLVIGTNVQAWDADLDTWATKTAPSGTVVGTSDSQILTTKTIDLASNTLTGTIAQFNTACSDADFATLAGSENLTNKTITSPTLVTPSAFTTGGTITLAENTSIALDPSLSADGKYTGITMTGTAGATLAFGKLIYLDPTDSRRELVDANSVAGADGDARGVIGMCVLPAAADGDPTVILFDGVIRADAAFPAFTVNNPIYASETAGEVTGTQPSTTDAVIRVVGFGLTADTMYFRASNDYITHI